jgi:hypothetical protein
MAERARVTSVEALASFRASLMLYLSKARPTLEEASHEVARMRQWLESDRRPHWDNELRRRRRKLEEAEQVLFSAKLSPLQEQTASQAMAVRRAKSAVEEAELKRGQVRQWTRDFENRTDPLTRQIGLLHGFLTTEMARAAAQLGQVIETLEAYANVAAPGPGATAERAEGEPPARGDGVSDGEKPPGDGGQDQDAEEER